MSQKTPSFKTHYSLGQFAQMTGQSYEAVWSRVRRGGLQTVQFRPGGWHYVTIESLKNIPGLWESILGRASLLGCLAA